MRRTKRLAAGLLCAAITALLIVPAAAHGCRGGRGAGCHSGIRQSVQATVTVCPLEDCTEAGRHTHDDVTYCGYDHESGICTGSCRALCPFEDCTEAGRHIHDGVAYCGYDHGCGFCDGGCLALCPLEDCTEAGRHFHGRTAYCGAGHDCGYCDGSCSALAGCGRRGGC